VSELAHRDGGGLCLPGGVLVGEGGTGLLDCGRVLLLAEQRPFRSAQEARRTWVQAERRVGSGRQRLLERGEGRVVGDLSKVVEFDVVIEVQRPAQPAKRRLIRRVAGMTRA
jgi:hypothetical protein